MHFYKKKVIRQLHLLLFAVFLIAQSCVSVRLISEYDEITDKKASSLQEKIASLFVQLQKSAGTDAAQYEKYTKTYEEIRVDLNVLTVRAAAIDKNKIVQDQIKELSSMVDNLEKLHKIGFVSPEMVKPLEQPFNSAFTAIVKLQLALKRGEKK